MRRYVPHLAHTSRCLGLLLALLIPCAAAAARQESKLGGTWQWAEGGVTLTLKLNGDGTGALNGESFKYTTRDNKLIVEDEEGEATVYTFSLDGDALTVSGGALPRALTFTRQGGRGKGVIEKSLGAGAERSPARADEGEGGLIGRWQSDAATVQISGDGTLTINGARFRYSVQGDFITLSNSEGSARVRFELDGDTLVTNYNGERNVYRRVAGGGVAAAAGRGANPAEMFGKWCYMSNVTASNGGRMSNTCFTLHENGTYDYYSETSSSGRYGGTASQESDSGTWSVSGATLTANSRARGTLTFRLERRNHPKTGDPMLVLDGDAFVTYSPREPWP